MTCGTRKLPALSYSLTGRYAMLDDVDLSGPRDWDLGLSIAAARRFGNFYVYLTLSNAWFGRDEFRGLGLKRTQLSGLLAGEWRFRRRMALLLQYLQSEGVIDGFGPFDDPSNEITVGWKWEALQRGVLSVGFIENIVEFDNSPDFGIHLGFSQRF